jgi:hypothetical protein
VAVIEQVDTGMKSSSAAVRSGPDEFVARGRAHKQRTAQSPILPSFRLRLKDEQSHQIRRSRKSRS